MATPNRSARRYGTPAPVRARGAAAGGSEDGEPFSEFTGQWLADGETSTSVLTCPAPAAPRNLVIWTELLLQPGTVTDLVESGANGCFFPFQVDAKNKKAAVPATDPYNNNEPPTCFLTYAPAGVVNVVGLLPTAAAPLEFQLLMPVKDMAPRAELSGTIGATVQVVNEATMTIGPPQTCSLSLLVTMLKFSNL